MVCAKIGITCVAMRTRFGMAKTISYVPRVRGIIKIMRLNQHDIER